jgi:DNA-binding Xre family transcriptional regulator
MTQHKIIKLLIEKAGSQSKLAEVTGQTQAMISECLNEKRSIKVGTLLKMCQKLKLTLKIEIYGSN